MRRLFIVAAIGLAACSQITPLVPPVGAPTAELNDSIDEDVDGTNPRVFAVLSINGIEVPNAARNVKRMGVGMGAAVFPLMVARPIEAKEVTVKVLGRHLTQAPINEFIRMAKGSFQEIEGTLTFTPKAGMVYRVAGTLSAQASEIWIEESESKIRVSGSVRK